MLTIILAVVAFAVLFYYWLYKPLSYWKNRGVTQGKPIFLFGHGLGVLSRTEIWADFVQRMYNQSPGTRYTGMYHLNYPLLVIRDIDLLKKVCVKDFDHFTDRISLLPTDTDPLFSGNLFSLEGIFLFRYTGMYHLNFPLLVIRDIDLLKQICVKDFDHFTNRIAVIPTDVDPLFSGNLFSLEGRKWREMRAILSPSFTSAKMRTIFHLMNESAQHFVEHFLKKQEEVIPVEMKDVFGRFSCDVIATTAFGVKVNSLEEPDNAFYKMGLKAIDFSDWWKNTKILLYRMIPPISKVLKVQLTDDDVATFFYDLINEAIKVREEKGIVRQDVIHLMLEARKELEKEAKANGVNGVHDDHETKETPNGIAKEKFLKTLTNMDIASQALAFFFAGFDSVSSTIGFGTYELALQPDVQQKLRDEIQTTWEECNGKLTYEALLDMKYLDMVVIETLRKWPNNIAMDRVCTKPYTIEPVLPGEVPIHLKVGDPLWLPFYAIQRDPELFPNPDKFDPERFSEENKKDMKTYSFLTFGIGPRSCIGSRFALMEIKMILFYILLNFEVVPIEKTPIPLKLSKKSFFLMCDGDFWVGFKKL